MDELLFQYQLARGCHIYIWNVTIHSHFSQCFSRFFSLSWHLCLDPFLCKPHFSYISTIHPYLTYLLSWHLSLPVSEEHGGRNLLSYDLHCSGHFLINAADKVIVYHLIQMKHATPGQKLPYCPLTSTSFRFELPLRIPQNTMIHFFSSSSGFFPWACGLQYFHVSTATFQLPSRSSGQCCNPSTSSSVIKHPQ